MRVIGLHILLYSFDKEKQNDSKKGRGFLYVHSNLLLLYRKDKGYAKGRYKVGAWGTSVNMYMIYLIMVVDLFNLLELYYAFILSI